MNYDAVVFDFDGVLVESVEVKTRAFAMLYAEYGADVERQVVAYHLANTGISRRVKFKYFHESILGLPYSEATGDALSERFSALVVEAVIAAPYVQGAEEFLERFHQRLPLFVASGTPEVELKEIVNQRGMTRFFQGVRGSPTKKGMILRGIIGDHGFAPARVLMVGDAQADLDGAREASTAFIGRSTSADHPFNASVPMIADLRELAARL